MNDSGVVVFWWTALAGAGLLNVALWLGVAVRTMRRREAMDADERRFWKLQVLLSAGFVFGCAFRSFVPRADVQRIGLVDSWISAVAVGRSVATVAELCFMAQMAFHLRRLGRSVGSRAAVLLSYPILPMIATAECFSWYAVLTTNYLGNAVEESLWTASAALLVAGCAAAWPRCGARRRRLLAIPFVAGPCYLAFMSLVDVPMYLGRWRADRAAGRAFLSLADGWRDAAHRWVVTFRLDDWRAEIPWMTLYFTAAVWISLTLASPVNEEDPR